MTDLLQWTLRIYLTCVVLTILHFKTSCVTAGPVANVCTSPECWKLGESYLKNINKNVNPCKNFYDYVCHGWTAQHFVPSFVETWKVEEVLEEKAFIVLKNLLEDPKVSPLRDVEEAKALYKACMNLPTMKPSKPIVIQNIMMKVGNWPMFFPKNKQLDPKLFWWQIDNEYIKRTGESAFFSFRLIIDASNKRRIITFVTKPSSPYGMLDRRDKWDFMGKRKGHYKAFLMKVIQTVAPQNPPTFKGTIERDLKDVLTFRDKLYEILNGLNKAPFETSILKIQKWYDDYPEIHETRKINWLEMIRHLYKDSKDTYGIPIQEQTVIRIQKFYAEQLAVLLENTPKRVIVNHIHLYFAERYITLTFDMRAELAQSYGMKDGQLAGFMRPPAEGYLKCIGHHFMRDTLKAMYLAHSFSPEQKFEVETLFNDAKHQLQIQITNSAWLDHDRKVKSLSKLQSITSAVGYKYVNASKPDLGLQLFGAEPWDPTIYYVPVINRVFVTVSFLQAPNYDPSYPYVIKYGTIVPVLGHEIQHAYDQDILELDQYGETDKWESKMRKEYYRRAKCYKDRYTKYRKEVLNKHKLPPWASLPSTLSEDIADSIGLKIGYAGYREKLEANKHRCPLLPGFEKYGCEKLFFIAYGNMFCGAMTTIGEKLLLTADIHSLPKIRLNGAVANMQEFSAAFGCARNDPMNEKDKCQLW